MLVTKHVNVVYGNIFRTNCVINLIVQTLTEKCTLFVLSYIMQQYDVKKNNNLLEQFFLNSVVLASPCFPEIQGD